ncbi:hypothetical protein [Vibrio sp. ZF57]|uniref:hypothetical protein n=1 Tax=Vibrio sp. ZF57 TaxID=1840084 RepID=UPI00080EAF91|nr:hypothetical protein [Vibrio sp. ZF57]OCH53646.1 hypothetical protein A6D97_02425 [Vibrio sp. ZF57]
MSITKTQFKLLRVGILGFFITLMSASSNANESKFNTAAPKNNSVPIAASELTNIKAILSEQEAIVRNLIVSQQRNEKDLALDVRVASLEKTLELITSKKFQPTEETQLAARLESIESSLSSMAKKDKYFTYADWAAIAITCVAVLLTIIGLAIGALAFWGYRELKDMTKNSASEEARLVAKQTMEEMIYGVARGELEKLINDGKLREPLQDAVDMILRSDSDSIDKKRTEELLNELDTIESEFDSDEDDESIGNDKK